MIVVLLIFLIFLWFVAMTFLDNISNETLEDQRILDELNEKGQKFLHFLGSTNSFHLHSTTTQARTVNKKDIYLVLKKKNGEYFDDNTLFGVLIHELAHVLSSSEGHNYPFDEIEERLYDQATNIGFYSKKIGIDPNYPCIE